MKAPRALVTIGLGLGLLLAGVTLEAQQPARTARVGTLSLAAGPNPNMDIFQGLRELGWIEGKNLTVESRWAAGREGRLPALAAELVRSKVDLIVTASTPAARAAKEATATIPIVMTFVADPVGSGLVVSLGRPGGNVTGVTSLAAGLLAKRVELLKDMAPRAKRLAVLWQPGILGAEAMRSMREETETAARTLALHPQFIGASGSTEVDQAFETMKDARTGALLVFPDPVLFEARGRIVELAARNHLPAVYPWREAVETGGLASYSTNFPDMFRRAAVYVDKILKGARPADLPIEQPTRFELVINLRTAKALGLTIPPSVLQRADQVIR